MMKSILLLTLFVTATSAMGQDVAHHNHPSITNNNDHVDKHKRVGLRGLASDWQKVPGQSKPFVAELVEDILENEDDDKDIFLVYEEIEEGDEDEVIAVMFKGDHEGGEELVAGLMKEMQDTAKNPRKKKESKGRFQSSTPPDTAEGRGGDNENEETVRWVKKPEKNESKGRFPSSSSVEIAEDEGGDTANKDKMGRKKGQKKVRGRKPANMRAKRVERWPTTSSPTVAVDHAFPTLAPSSIIKVDVDDYQTVTTSPQKPMTSEEPTTFAPTPAMATMEPNTSSPTTNEIFSWPESTAAPTMATIICPPHYSTSTTYTVGDTIEANSRIYQCQSNPSYCNIAELDESWNDNEKELWENAWVHVGGCEKVVVEEEVEVEARDDAVVGGATEAPIATTAATTSTSTSMVTTTTEAPTTSEAAPQLPPCPTNYVTSKTTYIAGEHATVQSHIFKCREEQGYEIYCNIAVWYDSLSAQNENAKEMWTNAWEEVGACEPTQEELMEEEAVLDAGDDA